MRIVLDARYLTNRYSGIATYSHALIENLSALDSANTYYVIVHKNFKGRLELGENFEILEHPSRPVSVATLANVNKVLEGREYDLWHSLFPLAPLYCPKPVLVTLHDLQPFWDPNFSGRRIRPLRAGYDAFYRWVYPATMRLARWIVVDSEATRTGLRELFPELAAKAIVVPLGLSEKAHIAPPAADVERTRDKYDLNMPFLLYYGSTRPNKNLPRLATAYGILRERYPQFADTRLVLAVSQDRFFADTQAIIEKQERLRTAVRVLPPISDAERRCLLAAAEVFCFPSMYEGFGLPVLEAQAAGTPVLGSTSAALPETGGDGALYADPEDPEDMAELLARLLIDNKLRWSLIEKGKANVERFSWKETARQTLEIYTLLF